jgi:hypothetical protein
MFSELHGFQMLSTRRFQIVRTWPLIVAVGAGDPCTSLCTMQWLTSRCLHQLVYRAYTAEFAQENPALAELFQSNAEVSAFVAG